jgi:glycosyltransferase involved in cell wall biosynthesis
MLDPEQYSIRIVGGGDLTAELQKQAQSLELSHVHFLGKLSKEDLTKEYLNANAFVLPAIVDSKGDTEGLGVVLIEAIEYNLPVIASNVGGIPDVIVDQKTGLLVQEKNASALKLAIESLATNQNLQNHLTKNAYEHVQKHFSWDIIVQKQIELYQNLSTKD